MRTAVDQKYNVRDRETNKAVGNLDQYNNEVRQNLFEVKESPVVFSRALPQGKRFIDKDTTGKRRLCFPVDGKMMYVALVGDAAELVDNYLLYLQVQELSADVFIFETSDVNDTAPPTNTPTINDFRVCRIETDSLTTVAGYMETITLTSNLITVDSVIVCSPVWGGTYTQGYPIILKAIPAAGSVAIDIINLGGQAFSADLDGTLKFSVVIF